MFEKLALEKPSAYIGMTTVPVALVLLVAFLFFLCPQSVKPIFAPLTVTTGKTEKCDKGSLFLSISYVVDGKDYIRPFPLACDGAVATGQPITVSYAPGLPSFAVADTPENLPLKSFPLKYVVSFLLVIYAIAWMVMSNKLLRIQTVAKGNAPPLVVTSDRGSFMSGLFDGSLALRHPVRCFFLLMAQIILMFLVLITVAMGPNVWRLATQETSVTQGVMLGCTAGGPFGYRYTVDGKTYVEHNSICKSDIPPNRALRVYYLPENPAVSSTGPMTENNTPRSDGYFMIGGIVFWLAPMGALGGVMKIRGRARRHAERQRRILETKQALDSRADPADNV